MLYICRTALQLQARIINEGTLTLHAWLSLFSAGIATISLQQMRFMNASSAGLASTLVCSEHLISSHILLHAACITATGSFAEGVLAIQIWRRCVMNVLVACGTLRISCVACKFHLNVSLHVDKAKPEPLPCYLAWPCLWAYVPVYPPHQNSSSICSCMQVGAAMLAALAGDKLQFGLAAESAKAEGHKVEMVLVGDDCSLPGQGVAGRRGIAGALLVNKVTTHCLLFVGPSEILKLYRTNHDDHKMLACQAR